MEDLRDLEGLAHPRGDPLRRHRRHLRGAAGDEHHPRHVRCSAHAAGAAHGGHRALHVVLDGGDVEQRGVEGARRQRAGELAAVADADHVRAAGGEGGVEQIDDGVVVLDEEDARPGERHAADTRAALPGRWIGETGGLRVPRGLLRRVLQGRRRRRRGDGAERPGQLEAGARGPALAEREGAALRARQGGGMTQPDAGAARARAETRVEEGGPALGRDAGPLVGDGEHDGAAGTGDGLDAHRRAGRRHGDGVEQQVGEDLEHGRRVVDGAVDHGRGDALPRVDAGAAQLRLEAGDGVGEDGDHGRRRLGVDLGADGAADDGARLRGAVRRHVEGAFHVGGRALGAGALDPADHHRESVGDLVQGAGEIAGGIGGRPFVGDRRGPGHRDLCHWADRIAPGVGRLLQTGGPGGAGLPRRQREAPAGPTDEGSTRV